MTRYHNTPKKKTAQAITDQNRKAALDAAEHGQRVFPVIVTRHPKNPDKKKADIPVKWMNEATTDAKQINSWWDKHPDAAPGMVTGDCLVVDLDDRDGKDGSAAYSALGLDPEDALFAVETPSGGQHLYFENPAKLRNTQNDIAPGIDTRGVGGFVFAPGARTIFGEYRLMRGGLTDIQFGYLTQVPKPVRQALAKSKEPASQPDPGNADIEMIRASLSYVSSDCGHDEWADILMAVHHATGGSKDGLALVIGWSAGHQEFTFKEVQTKWRSFGKKDGPQKTIDTLFARARENGWERADPDDLLTNNDVSGPLKLADIDRMIAGEDKPFFLDMADLLASPAPTREWLVPDWIPANTVHMMGGDGGTGKTLLAMQLTVCTGTNNEWLGHKIAKPGVVLYYGAEDDRDEMHRRLEDVCRGLDVDPAEHRGRVHPRATGLPST